jgi:hypothetical protein
MSRNCHVSMHKVALPRDRPTANPRDGVARLAFRLQLQPWVIASGRWITFVIVTANY